MLDDYKFFVLPQSESVILVLTSASVSVPVHLGFVSNSWTSVGYCNIDINIRNLDQ